MKNGKTYFTIDSHAHEYKNALQSIAFLREFQ